MSLFFNFLVLWYSNKCFCFDQCFIISLHITTESPITFLAIYDFCSYMVQDSENSLFCTHDVLLDLHIWIKSHFLRQFYIYICVIYILFIYDLFIPVIISSTCKCKSSVSFGTHTLLDKSSRVLQVPAHLSRLTANG